MKIRKYASWMCGLTSAALLILPGTNVFADTSSPVTCKDGTTSPHGGRGSCSGHGGIDKAATAAAAGGSSSGGGAAAGSAAPAATPAAATTARRLHAAAAPASSHSRAATAGDRIESTAREPGGSARRWTGHGVGELCVEGLPLSFGSVVRQDQGGRVHDRGGREGQGQSR